MNIEDLDSDVSDEDYVPEGQNVVLPSEEESDGDVEDDLIPADQSKKRGKSSKKISKKSKKTKTEDAEIDSDNDEESLEPSKPLTAEEEKKKADSLWADFLKDTDTKPKSINKVVENKNIVKPTVSSETKIHKPVEEKKVKVTRIFEFAGEEVRVEKEVPVNSLEAKLSTGSGGIATRGRSPRGRGGGSSSSAGLSSVLSQLGKKQKITTLEKTKLDWDKFKKEENIEEELENFNKGKHGYLERQDFLDRADLRQFEIEKEIRATHRSQRL